MRRLKFVVLLIASIGLLGACEKKAQDPVEPEAPKAEAKPEAVKTPLETARASAGMFKALPANYKAEGQTKAMEDLGRKLYFEKKLSVAGDLSCNSCHLLDKFGADGQPTSPGHKGQLGGRNSPTVYNAAGHVAQFWDGREKDVEAQAKGPILNPIEMAMPSEEAVIKVLKADAAYPAEFKTAFPADEDPVTYDNLAKAIGAFERNLTTPARFDKFLGGDDKALTEGELEGFNLFVSSGCVACHGGELLGGTTYQKLGAVTPWPNQKDQGRFDVTKAEADKMSFKTPSLRNIEKTGPYFHDGSVSKLDESVAMMAKHQLGKELKAEETAKIVTFLASLTGEVDAEYIKNPHPAEAK